MSNAVAAWSTANMGPPFGSRALRRVSESLTHECKKNSSGEPPKECDELALPAHRRPGDHSDLKHTGQFGESSLQAGGRDVGIDRRPAAARSGAFIMSDRARPIMVCRRTVGPAFGQRTRALSDRNAMTSGCSSTSSRNWPMYPSSLSSKLFAETIAALHLGPQTAVAGFEEVQRQFLLAREMLVQGGIGVAALLGDVANARRVEPCSLNSFIAARRISRLAGGSSSRM